MSRRAADFLDGRDGFVAAEEPAAPPLELEANTPASPRRLFLDGGVTLALAPPSLSAEGWVSLEDIWDVVSLNMQIGHKG